MMRALVGPLAGRGQLVADDLEEGYAVAPMTVRANFVVSLDGVVALDGTSGGLGGPADQEVFATLRALSDVIVVGAATARAEHYGPAWLSSARRERRIRRGQAPLPAVAVVTSGADLDPGSRLFTERRDDQPAPPLPLVFTSAAAPADRVAALGDVATVVALGPEGVDLTAMVAHLAARGLDRVLCEGGPGLLGQLVVAGLVDDFCLSHAPLLAGPGLRTLAGDPDGTPYRPPVPLALLQLLEDDGLLLARYTRRPVADDAPPPPAAAG
jgi:riboflavin biosynthesis pyrimidine reductase